MMVVVVGAGIGGMTAALGIARSGHTVPMGMWVVRVSTSTLCVHGALVPFIWRTVEFKTLPISWGTGLLTRQLRSWVWSGVRPYDLESAVHL